MSLSRSILGICAHWNEEQVPAVNLSTDLQKQPSGVHLTPVLLNTCQTTLIISVAPCRELKIAYMQQKNS